MGLYVTSNPKIEKGATTMMGVQVFMCGLNLVVFVIADYVRFGSRRKLAAAGYHSTLATMTSKISSATGTLSSSVTQMSKSGTSSIEAEEGKA